MDVSAREILEDYVKRSAPVAGYALVFRQLLDQLAEEEQAKSAERIAELEKDSETLARLEAAGVDNWEGYSHAFEDEDE